MNTLDDVQTGDVLIMKRSGTYQPKQLARVDGVTGTQIKVGHNRFRKSDGRLIGARIWDSALIWIPSENEIQEVSEATEKRNIAAELRARNWDSVSLETLRQIKALITTPSRTT